MVSAYHATAASMSCTAIATWSMSVSRDSIFPPRRETTQSVTVTKSMVPSRELRYSSNVAGGEVGNRRSMTRSVIVAGLRTPIGKLAGTLAPLRASELGGVAIAALLAQTGIDPASVDAVLMGQVLQAGQGQITARQAAVAGGIPMTVPATTINKVCLSGLSTIYLADLMVRSGEADVVIAGGMESMTNAPYLLPGARAGYRVGDHVVVDAMMHDALTCAFDHCAMGLATERHNSGRISRARQDEFAARSHFLAAAATSAGYFEREITAVSVPQRKGEDVRVEHDEGIRRETTAESLGRLRGAFEA